MDLLTDINMLLMVEQYIRAEYVMLLIDTQKLKKFMKDHAENEGPLFIIY